MSEPPVRESLGTTFKRPVRKILLPSTAGPNDTQILIGQDIPPELEFDANGFTTLAVVIYRYNEEEYYFHLMSSDGSISFFYTGVVNLGADVNKVTWTSNVSISGGGLDTARAYFEHGNSENGNFDADGVQWPVTHDYRYAHLIQGRRAAYPSNGSPRQICGESEGICEESASQDCTSGSYIDMTDVEITFFKFYEDTRIKVSIQQGLWCDVDINTVVMLGCQINSVDTDLKRHYFNVTGQHVDIGGTGYISGVGAGQWTIKGRWKRTGGVGTIKRDNNDWVSFNAEEVTEAA